MTGFHRVMGISIVCAAAVAGLSVAQTMPDQAAGPTSAEPAPTTRRSSVRLNYPWTRVQDLTPDQKARILAIRQDIANRIRDLREQERTLCAAVLSESQRAALDEAIAADDMARKLREAELRAARRATTVPVE